VHGRGKKGSPPIKIKLNRKEGRRKRKGGGEKLNNIEPLFFTFIRASVTVGKKGRERSVHHSPTQERGKGKKGTI